MNAVLPIPILPLSLPDAALEKRWVAWRTEDCKGKLTKVPYNSLGTGRAKANDPSTWGNRAQAECRAGKLLKPYGLGGVGLELGDLGDGRILGGVDLDTCRDEAGVVAPWALEVVKRFATYTEVSPSGTGLKLFFLLASVGMPELQTILTPTGGKLFKQAGSDHPPAMEVYLGGRYFAVTGLHFTGTPEDLQPVPQAVLLWLLKVAGPAFASINPAAAVDDRADGAFAAHERSVPATRRAKRGADQSRSALAFCAGAKLVRNGASFDEMAESLNLDPAHAPWTTEKGEADGKRELRRIYDKAVTDALDLTEDGIALAFTGRHTGQLLYCHGTGSWYVWTGTVWQQERTKLAFSYARQICRELGRRAAPDDRPKIAKASFAAAVERYAQSDRAFAVTSDIWDPDPWLLGTPGGVVDLRTAVLRPAQQMDYITKLTAVAPAAETDCPLWLKFLQETTAGDDELLRFLRQWCGYCLTGDTREHALLFGFGPGGNGKSVFLNTVARVMGSYARNAAMETFTASANDRHPTDLAMLRGARLVTASETEEGRAWAEVRIKQLTGGDPITARFMRQDFFEYQPQFKLMVVGNHKPALKAVDDAMRRRFNIVPFLHKPSAPDKQLEAKLQAEWPAILRWMMEGCLDWQRNGLIRPAVVTDATEAYFDAQDHFPRWLAECCNLLPTASTRPAHLLHSFTQWCQANGEMDADNRKLRGMIERTPGLRYATTKGIQSVRGIAIKSPPLSEGDEGGVVSQFEIGMAPAIRWAKL